MKWGRGWQGEEGEGEGGDRTNRRWRKTKTRRSKHAAVDPLQIVFSVSGVGEGAFVAMCQFSIWFANDCHRDVYLLNGIGGEWARDSPPF